MTLREAIDHCYEKANELKKQCCECANEHLQLARWLEELDGLRRQTKEMQREIDSLRRDLGQFM